MVKPPEMRDNPPLKLIGAESEVEAARGNRRRALSLMRHVVTEDPDAAWEVIAPHAMHETNAYGEWMQQAGLGDENATYKTYDDPDALRAAGDYAVVTPDELIETARGMGPMDSVLLHPLVGGIHPDFSWECLRLIEKKVLPALG